MVEYRPAALAAQIEQQVAGHVHGRRPVGSSDISYFQRIIFVEIESGLDLQITGIPLIAVVGRERHHDPVGFDTALPQAPGEALHTAVEMPGHAVYIQAVFFAVNPHRPVSDATGHAADAFAAQGWIAEITAEILVTQRHIRQMSVTIGNQNRHDSRADIAKPHFGTCGIAQRIEHNGLALRSGAPDLLFDLHPYSPGFRLRSRLSIRRRVSSFPMKEVTSYIPGPLPAPTSARRSVFITCPSE